MSVLHRKLSRDLKAVGLMLVAVTGIMAVGVTAFVATRSAYQNLRDAQFRYYVQCRMADFTIDLKKAPIADLAPLAAIPGVTELRPRLQFAVTVDLERVPEPLNGIVLSLPEQPTPVINDIVLQRGSYFTNQRAEEVIINDAFARHHNLHPGEWIHLLLNNRRQALFIVGTAKSSEFVYLVGKGSMVPDTEHLGVFYLKRRYLEEVFDFQGACNQVLGLLAPAVREHPEAVLQYAEQLLVAHGVITTTPRKDQASNKFLSNEIRGLSVFAVVMPVIFLGVAAMVLNILMRRLSEQQRTVIGTLKAVGYADGQVLRHFLMFGIAVGLTGGLAGCLFGYLQAGMLTRLYRTFFEFPELTNQFYPGVTASGTAISLAAGLFGAARGARAVLRLQPAQAMRPQPPRQGGAIFLERVGWLWRRLGTGWRMVLRNLFRNRRRTMITVFAASMGAGLSVFAMMVNRAIAYQVEFQFEKVLLSDVDLTFREERGADALNEASRLPGVTFAEPVFGVVCTFRNGVHWKRGSITGLQAGAKLTIPRDRSVRPIPIPTHGLTMARMLAEMLHVQAGDLVTVEPIRGDRAPRPVRVVALADAYIGLDVYADIRFLSRLLNEDFALTGVQLRTDPRPERLAALFAELKRLPALEGVSTHANMVNNLVETLVKTNRVFTGILVVFAGVIFFGTTLNSSLIGLAERQREVATLLVMGYKPGTVGGLFFRESMLINLVGTILGLPLGYLLFRMIAVIYESEMFRIPTVNPLGAWLPAMFLGLIFTLLAQVLVQRAINRMDWLEKLKVFE